VLYRALQVAERLITNGSRDVTQVTAAARHVIEGEPAVTLEYLEIVEPREMQPVERIDGPVVAAGAVWIGSTRLIDNIVCVPR
jgi:pantoate--beta-alanine ligase